MATYISEPIPVYLRQDQYDALQALAAHEGVGIDELVRQGVDTLLTQAAQPGTSATESSLEDDPFGDLIGMMDSGVNDLAEHHDQYLIEFEMDANRQWPAKSS